MKVFVSYRFSGEHSTQLNQLLTTVQTGLEQNGVESFCSFFYEDHYQQQQFDSRQIMHHALGHLDDSHALLGIITSDEKSAGMLMEVGYALACKVPIVLGFRADVTKTYLADMASEVFTWTDLDDLQRQLANYQFSHKAN